MMLLRKKQWTREMLRYDHWRTPAPYISGPENKSDDKFVCFLVNIFWNYHGISQIKAMSMRFSTMRKFFGRLGSGFSRRCFTSVPWLKTVRTLSLLTLYPLYNKILSSVPLASFKSLPRKCCFVENARFTHRSHTQLKYQCIQIFLSKWPTNNHISH